MARQEWVCQYQWVQASISEGAYSWQLLLVDSGGVNQKRDSDTIILKPLAEGIAMTKLGVWWQVFWACRKHKLGFRINTRGKLNGR